MNYRLNVFLLLVFSTTISIAQVNFTNPDEGNILSFQTKEIDLTDVKTEGSPYLDEKFKQGKVLFRGEEKLKGNLRYNAYNSEIELQKNDYEYTAVLKRNYISAKIGDKLYKIFPFIDEEKGNTRTGYFIPLNEGEITLLHKPEVKLRRGRAPATSYGRLEPPRFIDISSYYIQKEGQPATKIYLRKKYFYDTLGKENVQNFLKENRLKLNKVEDALKLLDYYNKS